MALHYYLTVFPVEALIASELEPPAFGAYMAVGPKRGSYENIVFLGVEGGFGTDFDWTYAKVKCVPHADGRPKNSVYLSVYRTLEKVPFSALRSLYLTTRDGRTLELEKTELKTNPPRRDFWFYQELCPIRPLAVSALDPLDFSTHMTHADTKTHVPKLIFAGLRVFDLSGSHTGSVGPAYDRNLDHLRDCIDAVTKLKSKSNKIVDRSHVDRFSYQIVDPGIYIGEAGHLLFYPMKPLDDLRRHHFEWARSAQIF